jgi:type 1 glutamine amidotransferase
MIRQLFLCLILFCAAPAWARTEPIKPDTLLIITHTTGFRHASIEPARAALAKIGAEAGLKVEVSGDPTRFDRPLEGVAIIALVSTTTDPNKPESEWLTGGRREALQGFVRRGGGIVGIHGAADAHYGWDWYGRMIGGRFARHPAGTPTGKLTRTVMDHPAVAALPDTFQHTDEWYWFDDLDPRLQPLLTLDPASVGEQGANPRPLAWAHRFEGGRVFYTALGHTVEAWSNPLVLAHVKGGMLWAAGRAPGRPMAVVAEADTRVEEPPPHGRIGMSTAWRITDGVPDRTMEYRKRALHPGAAIGIHPIDHDEVYHVISGEGEVTSDGVTARLGPGMIAYLYTGARVGIRQLGREPLVLIISYPLTGK